MASAFTSSASALGQSAYINVKSRGMLTASIGVVLLLAFAGMVTAAYTADHIKRSSCDMTKDEMLTSAYKWSVGSAVISALVAVAMGAALVKFAMKPKSA